METNEDGLTLVEMMVALMVVGLILAAMASVLMTAMHSMQRSERVVASTQLGNEVLEDYLAVDYDALGHYSSEASGHFGSAEFEGEDLVLFPDPVTFPTDDDRVVPEPYREETRNGVVYEIETAVTWIDDDATADAHDYKRISVLLTWHERGVERTARTEATRSPAPEEQPLSVTVTPDVLRIRDDGRLHSNSYSFEIVVRAKEAQNSVSVRWGHRDPTHQGDGTSGWKTLTEVAGSNGLEWSRSVQESSNDARFANGGTLFEVRATSAVNEQDSTTIGRAAFLQDLALPGSNLDIEPVYVHASEGVCGPLDITAHVIGALKSDPFTLTFDGDDEEVDALAFGAVEGLPDGASFHLEVDPDLVPAPAVGETLGFSLLLQRAVDPDEIDGSELRESYLLTVNHLPEGVPCPA